MTANSITTNNLRSRGIAVAIGLSFVAVSVLAGCATPPTNPEAKAAYEEANDPLEPTNRAIFDANLAVDRVVIKPAAKAYRQLPQPVRTGFHNLLETFRAPVLFANFVLQGNFGAAAETIMRTVYNVIGGMGGTVDVAAATGLPRKDTDFGVTLGKWGIGDGPYLMLPLFGPSNPRDTVGLVVDSFLDPVGYFTTWGEDVGRFAAAGVDKRERNLEPLDEIQRTSVDFYATLRSLYRQRRQDQIHKGVPGSNIPAPSISFDGSDMDVAPVQGAKSPATDDKVSQLPQ
jgi:phospholipid-binding lipoprotein MlaA